MMDGQQICDMEARNDKEEKGTCDDHARRVAGGSDMTPVNDWLYYEGF